MTPEEKIRELEARIARLENQLSLPPPLPVKPVEPSILPSPRQANPAPSSFEHRIPVRTPPPRRESPPQKQTEAPQQAQTKATSAPRAAAFELPDRWLAWVGIVLVFLGVLFFLKLSMDRGWISPGVRILFGAAASLTLLAFGELLRLRRPVLARTLGGGGIACAFGTILAARLLYGMLSPETAFLGTVGIAAAGLVFALRQDSQLLAIFSTLGGYLAPLILGIERFAAGPLAVHACIVLLAAMTAYSMKNWRVLYYVSAIGAWLFLFSMAVLGQYVRETGWMERMGWGLPEWVHLFRVSPDVRLIQSAILFAGVIISGAPFVGACWRKFSTRPEIFFSAMLVPLVSWGLAATLWNPGATQLGYLALGFSILYLGLGIALWRAFHHQAFPDYMVSAGLTLTLAVALLFGGSTKLACFSGLLVAFNLCALVGKYSAFRQLGHLLAVIVSIGVLDLSFNPGSGIFGQGGAVLLASFALVFSSALQRTSVMEGLYLLAGMLGVLLAAATMADSRDLNACWVAAIQWVIGLAMFVGWRSRREIRTLAYLVFFGSGLVIDLALLGMTNFDPPSGAVLVWMAATGVLLYLTAHVGVGAFLHVTVLALWSFWFSNSDSPQWTSIGWAIYAIALFALGITLQRKGLLAAAWSALAVMLIRLFTVDLAELDMLWRSIVFVGIGAMLLCTVYFLPQAAKKGLSGSGKNSP